MSKILHARDDQIVVATEHIGPMATERSGPSDAAEKPEAETP